MHGRRHIMIGAGLALLLATTSLVAAEPDDDGRLRIALQAEVEVTESLVRVSDVALIFGGNAVQRERIGALDLFEMTGSETTTQVERLLIEARLLVSGEAAGSYVVTGAAVARVSLSQNRSAEQRVLDAARNSISEQLALPADEVVVQLSQPLTAELVELINATDTAQFVARPTAPIGRRTRVDLWLQGSRGGQLVRPVAIDVRFRQLAPVAVRPLKARQKLTPDDVALETRDLPRRGVSLTLEQLIGKTLRKPVVAGGILAEGDLVVIFDDKDPVIIRPRDVVRVTARKRNLTLEMPAAEAMQAGRMGETIRVRNTATQKVIIGRVAGPGEVEVPL